jgi:hypothetical protein
MVSAGKAIGAVWWAVGPHLARGHQPPGQLPEAPAHRLVAHC